MDKENLKTLESFNPKLYTMSTVETSQDAVADEEDKTMRTFVKYSMFFWWILLILWVIIDLIWGLDMFNDSIQETISLQHIQSGVWVWYNNTWFAFTDFIWSWWPLVAVACYPDKRVALKTFTLRLIMMWLKNNLKLIYLDNRPNIVSKDIVAITCRCEFGKPSGTLINTTVSLMFIFWDLFARHPKINLKCRIASLFIAKLITVQILFTVMWMGLHSYNQMIYAILISVSFFYLFVFYDKYLLMYWYHIIDHKANPRLTRKFFWLSGVITVLMIAIYVGMMLGRWNSKDFTIALEGACPSCAYVNWCWETIAQDSSCFGYPAAVVVLGLRSHEWRDNPNFIRQNCNLKGLLRFVLTFIAWMPVSVWWWPHFGSFTMNIVATPIKLMIGCSLVWILLPWLFAKWGLKVDGDIAECSVEGESGRYQRVAEATVFTEENKKLNSDVVIR